MEFFSFFDLFFAILLSLLLYQRSKNKFTASFYKGYHHKGLLAKFIGTFLFCGIYLFYYQGGDTINYYHGIKTFYDLFWKDIGTFFRLMLEDDKYVYYIDFAEHQVGFPPKYMLKDSRTLMVIKITTFLSFPALGGFFSTSILLSYLTYRWIWRGFTFVLERYPEISKQLSWCFLYLPSIIFWGSGIMKDTFTYAASAYSLYAINEVFVKGKRNLSKIVALSVAVYLIISIKAYIIFALLPGILIFLNFERIAKIKSTVVKLIVLPFFTLLFFLIGQGFFLQLGDQFGKYSADRILEEAVIQQQDLTRTEAYGENVFDIGEFDATLTGVLSKAHLAISAALYRPFLWEVGSPTMVFSAIENTMLLLASLYFLIKVGPFKFFKNIFNDAYLIFCLSFTIILAFGIGLSTASFGALVRYKIPFLPYFSSMFFILYATKRKRLNPASNPEKS